MSWTRRLVILSAKTEAYYQNGLQVLYRQHSITSMNLKLAVLNIEKTYEKIVGLEMWYVMFMVKGFFILC